MGRDGDGVQVRDTSIRISFTYPAGVHRRETLKVDGIILPPTPANVKLARRVAKAVRDSIRADGILRGQASKTGKRFAIDMSASPTLAPLLARRRTYPAAHVCLLSHPSGAMVAERHLTDRFTRARAAAVAAHPKLRDLARMILRDCRKLAAEAAPSLSAAADLLQHDDQRLTRAHYRRSVAPLKTVR